MNLLNNYEFSSQDSVNARFKLVNIHVCDQIVIADACVRDDGVDPSPMCVQER